MVELFKVRRSSSFAKGLTCHWGPTPLGGNLALFLSGVIDVEHVSSLAVCKGVAVCARNANWAPFESTRLFVCKRNSCRRLEIKGQEKSETLSLQISDFLATPTSSGLCFEMEWVSSPYLSIFSCSYDTMSCESMETRGRSHSIRERMCCIPKCFRRVNSESLQTLKDELQEALLWAWTISGHWNVERGVCLKINWVSEVSRG